MGTKSTVQLAQQAALTSETEPVTPTQAAQAAAPAPAAQPAAAPVFVKAGNGHANPLVLPESGTWVTGMETLEPGDFMLPYVRLTQSVSDDVQEGTAKPGELRHSITGELIPAPMEFVPIHVSRTRARFVDRARLCFSLDGITGQGDPGGECAKCPFSQWATDQSGKRVPPACSLGYQYVIIRPKQAEPLPLALIFAKTSAPAAKRLNYFIKAYRRGSVFALFTVKEKGPSGAYYYRFDVQRARDLTNEEAKAVLEIRAMLAGKTIAVEQEPSDFTFDQSAEVVGDGESPF